MNKFMRQNACAESFKTLTSRLFSEAIWMEFKKNHGRLGGLFFIW